MVSLLTTLALSVSAVSYPPNGVWVKSILESEAAKAVIASHARHPVVSWIPNPRQEIIHSGAHNTLVLPDEPIFTAIAKATRSVQNLLVENREDAAYAYISDLRQMHPEFEEGILDLCLKCELLTGHYDEAFQDVVMRITAGGFDAEEPYLSLALASAARGQVFSGQAEYCQSWIQTYTRYQGRSQQVQLGAPGQSPHDIMVLSALALGTKSTPEFLELALRLDPSNDIAARKAILYYGFRGRYSDIRRISSGMVDRLAAGESRDYYVNQISTIAGLKDKPLHPVIKP